jgi:uncharacterized protein YqeY
MMGSVKDTLKSDLKAAMIAKENFKRDTIRFLMAAIKQIEVDERIELDDDAIYKVIQKSLKQREDAAKQYKDAGRDDLYDKEVAEAEILKIYLPKQMDDEALRNLINDAIKSLDAQGMKDMGRVMKYVNEKVGSSADGKRVSTLVKELLN